MLAKKYGGIYRNEVDIIQLADCLNVYLIQFVAQAHV